MKRYNKKLISLVTAATLTATLIVNGSYINANAKVVSNERLKEAVVNQMKDYMKNNSKHTKIEKKTIDENKEKSQEEVVRVIVQLDDAAAIESEESEYNEAVKIEEEKVKNNQEKVIEEAEKITGKEMHRNFGYLVNGFSIDAKRKEIDKLSSIKGVRAVTEVKSYKPDMEYAKKLTEATKTWQDYGYKGEGMVVSIIDTGIDYNHKDFKNIDKSKIKITQEDANEDVKKLGYGSYFNDKIPFGYNYADGTNEVIDYTGSEHGMHVAGIVAANGSDEEVSTLDAVKGVAPEAQLLAMRVFTNNPNEESAYDDDVIAAIEDSVKLGADVINMSLGSDCGFTDPEDPENIAVEKATKAGTLCVISAGNSGISSSDNSSSKPETYLNLTDNATIGSPATAENCISVASVENTIKSLKKLSYESKDGSISKDIPYKLAKGAKLSYLSTYNEVVDCGDGSEDSFNNDVKGKIALIKRGGLTFQEKYENAINKGAMGVIIYNKDGDDSLVSMEISINKKVPILFIPNSSGVELLKNINGGIKYKFEDKGVVERIDNENTKDMSDFTSWGPTPTLDFKPEIAAPGGEIFSLANNNSYQAMSGTSMAAPHTAGAEALVLQGIKNKNLKIADKDLVLFAKNVVMNTAKILTDKYDETESIPYSPRRQGAGLIQIEEAIKNNVLITGEDGKAAVALKEVGNSKKFVLQLKNYGDKDVTYKLNTEKVYGESVDDSGLIHEVELKGSKVYLNKDEVTVPAGKTEIVECELNIDKDEAEQRFVEGFVHFNSSDEGAPSLSIPFMGFYGDWSFENIVDSPDYEDSLDSQLGQTGLGGILDEGFSYYGTKLVDDNSVIVRNNVAFSPNEDNVQDSIIPRLYLLRNSKNLKFQVLDKDKKVIRDLWSQENVRKSSISNGVGKNFSNANWDGKLYDNVTGKYKAADDGEYYIRVTSKTELEGAKEQILDLPLKVDKVSPTVEIQGVENISDSVGVLRWKAKDNDNASGMAKQATVAVNGELISLSPEDITEVNGVYSAKIHFNQNEVNTIQLAVIDNAGNTAITDKRVKGENLSTLVLSGVSDNMVVGAPDLVDGKFNLAGTAGDDVAKVLINEKEVNVNDNYFNELFELKEGNNVVIVKALDEDGEELVVKQYNILLDTKSPVMEVTPDIGCEKPYYVTKDSSVSIKVKVNDDTKSSVFVVRDNDASSIDLSDEGIGSFEAKLKDGINVINLVAYDEANNETTKKLIILKANQKEDFEVNIDNLSSVNYFSAEKAKDNVFTIEGHVNNKNVSKFKIAGQDVKIKDDLTFSVPVTLHEGANRILVEAVDLDGNVLYNYSYKVYYDGINPEIFLDVPKAKEDGNIYVNDEKFNVKGYVKDNFDGYTLYINGDVVINKDRFPVGNELKKDFSKDITLNNGLNELEFKLYDSIGNRNFEKLNVILDKEAPKNPEVKVIGNGSNCAEVEVITDEKQVERVEYSFDGENYFVYTGKIKVENSTSVYARVIDYAGNISEVKTVSVEVDNVAPKVNILNIVDGQTYYMPIKPSVDVDDKDSKITVLVNGHEYNGEVLDSEGKYVIEAYAVDKAGNKSEVIKKTVIIAQNTIDTVKGSKHVLEHNDVKAAKGEYTVFNSSTDESIEAIVKSDVGKVAFISPSVKVLVDEDVIKDKENLMFTQNISKDSELLKGIKSTGKLYDLSLKSGDKEVVSKVNNGFRVSIKLTEEELKYLSVRNLIAKYYDEAVNEWVDVSGKLVDSIFTFETSKLGKFVITQITNNNAGSDKTQGKDDNPVQKTPNPADKTVSSNGVDNSFNNNGFNKLTETGDTKQIKNLGILGIMTVISGSILYVFSKKREDEEI